MNINDWIIIKREPWISDSFEEVASTPIGNKVYIYPQPFGPRKNYLYIIAYSNRHYLEMEVRQANGKTDRIEKYYDSVIYRQL